MVRTYLVFTEVDMNINLEIKQKEPYSPESSNPEQSWGIYHHTSDARPTAHLQVSILEEPAFYLLDVPCLHDLKPGSQNDSPSKMKIPRFNACHHVIIAPSWVLSFKFWFRAMMVRNIAARILHRGSKPTYGGDDFIEFRLDIGVIDVSSSAKDRQCFSTTVLLSIGNIPSNITY